MNHEDLSMEHTQKAAELSLLDRVVLILEQAHANVVRAVNSSMVTAYWLIGREIVLELQGGDLDAKLPTLFCGVYVLIVGNIS